MVGGVPKFENAVSYGEILRNFPWYHEVMVIISYEINDINKRIYKFYAYQIFNFTSKFGVDIPVHVSSL